MRCQLVLISLPLLVTSTPTPQSFPLTNLLTSASGLFSGGGGGGGGGGTVASLLSGFLSGGTSVGGFDPSTLISTIASNSQCPFLQALNGGSGGSGGSGPTVGGGTGPVFSTDPNQVPSSDGSPLTQFVPQHGVDSSQGQGPPYEQPHSKNKNFKAKAKAKGKGKTSIKTSRLS